MLADKEHRFGKLTSIELLDQESWDGKKFLTFDIDWAHDDVLRDTIDLVELAGVPATWFVTHQTTLMERLRENPNFELGIHPNFNGLLKGDLSNGRNVEEVVERLMRIVPEAKCVRSHSTLQGSKIADIFVSFGLTHDSNDFILKSRNSRVEPWLSWNGLLKIPYCWADDVACYYGCIESLSRNILKGVQVFDFHPIHVFLNTSELSLYESTRDLHRCPGQLKKQRFAGFGARSFLKESIFK